MAEQDLVSLGSMLRSALAYHQAGELDRAEPLYREALGRDPNQPDALRLLGLLYQQRGQTDLALQFLERAVLVDSNTAAAHHDLASLFSQLGRIPEAIAGFKHALTLQPKYPEAWHNLGNAYHAAGDLAAAQASYRKALEQQPDLAETHFNLGVVKQDLGSLAEAVECYRAALQLRPDYVEALLNLGTVELQLGNSAASAESRMRLGVVLTQQGRAREALEYFDQALQSEPSNAERLLQFALTELLRAPVDANRSSDDDRFRMIRELKRRLAHCLQKQARWRDALRYWEELIVESPRDAEVLLNLGFCFQETGEFLRAEETYSKLLKVGNDAAVLRHNLGIVQSKLQRLPEALHSFAEALRLDPALARTNLAMANTYRELGKLEPAERHLRSELEIDPDCAEAAVNLGVILQESRRVSEAIECYRRALERNPQRPLLHWNLAIASLLSGDFATGWIEYEWRWQSHQKAKPEFPCPEWDGQDLKNQRILLYAEQGFGDTLMFIRYVSEVRRRHGRIIVQCQAGLRRFLASQPQIEEVIPLGQPLPEFDSHAPLMSLPRILGIAIDQQDQAAPYLQFPTNSLPEFPVKNPSALKVGLVWFSNPQHFIARDKSIDLPLLAPIANLPGCEFFSLQVELDPGSADFLNATGIHNLDPWLRDFADTASVLEQLDLVISVDTAVAHLAGALGRPVWVLLAYSADWRWFLDRTDSPWYPTMRLYRQSRQGDWGGVIESVCQDLTAHQRVK
jgi:tetratricopeptide (TPR) repeat protein